MKKELFLISIIFLSGCVQMNTTQELRRDGTMNVIVIINSPYFTLADAINDSLIPNPELNPVSERINNTLIYYFSKANPFSDNLFLSSNATNDLMIDSSGFLAGNTFKYETRFRFPYYYYYYSADFSSPSIQGEIFNESEILSLASMQDINYDIIYFGELVSTSGEEVDEQKVRFSAASNQNYSLTFREFFISNWIKRLTE
ncbi:MAG: hypothetical protein PHT91_02680 [Candidatus Nanoarchaeia archaeon]|nr:hypothetical protein [Candidatus Nanoarchaeia archaeon]